MERERNLNRDIQKHSMKKENRYVIKIIETLRYGDRRIGRNGYGISGKDKGYQRKNIT